MDTITTDIHVYDCKGRRHRLDNFAQELRQKGVKVTRTAFNSHYDGFAECEVTKEQFIMLYGQYSNRLHAVGSDFNGYTENPSEIFDNCIQFELFFNKAIQHYDSTNTTSGRI